MKVYLCGPMDIPNYLQAFSSVHIKLENKGYEVINPVILKTHLEKHYKDKYKRTPTQAEYLSNRLGYIKNCDVFAVMPGYLDNNECIQELKEARTHNLCVAKVVSDELIKENSL